MSKDLKPGWLVRSMDGAKNEIANCPNLQRLLVKSKADFGICLMDIDKIQEIVESHPILQNESGYSFVEGDDGLVYIVDNESGSSVGFMPRSVFEEITSYNESAWGLGL